MMKCGPCDGEKPITGVRADDDVPNAGRRQGGQEVADLLVGHGSAG
jgi:hypothetical protein